MSGPLLVTGIAGGLAQLVAARLRASGESVVGVDYRPTPPLDGLTVHRASYHKTAIEDVFRRHRPEAVLHLGRVGNLAEDVEMRFDLNVVGTRKIMQLALSSGTRTLVILSTFHIYGAHPRNHIPISEDDPLRSGHEFPAIADAIQLDGAASAWAWQHPELRVVVLRPTNVVGPHINNAMSTFLRRSRVPYLVGFNPMTQFIHEEDLGDAIVTALRGDARGVFNVVGGGPVPWRTALDLAGVNKIPVPSTLAKLIVAAFSDTPAYLVNFFKYPCIITDARFRETFGWRSQVDVRETLASTRRGQRRS